MSNFPHPSTLWRRPIADPISKVKDVFSFDFNKVQQKQATQPSTPASPAPAPADLVLNARSLSAPIDDVVQHVEDPELGRILQTLANLTGAQAFHNRAPIKLRTLRLRSRPFCMTNIEAVILAVITLISAHSTQQVLQGRVMPPQVRFLWLTRQARLQALLDQYGGATPIAAMISAVDAGDATAVAALPGRAAAQLMLRFKPT